MIVPFSTKNARAFVENDEQSLLGATARPLGTLGAPGGPEGRFLIPAVSLRAVLGADFRLAVCSRRHCVFVMFVYAGGEVKGGRRALRVFLFGIVPISRSEIS